MNKKVVYFIFFTFVFGTWTSDVAGQNEYMVLHLLFDEGSGEVTQDMSPTGLEATLEGSYDWTTGKFGQAIAFTDGRAVVSESDPLNLPQTTVMAWVNPASIAALDTVNWYTDINAIYGKAGDAGDDSVTLGLMAEDGVYFYTDTGANNELTVPDAEVSIGQWQHIAGTFDGTVMRVFVDGEQVGELPVVGSIIENPILPTVGGREDVAISFDGAIDEVKVFSQALTPGDIRNAMFGGVWPYAYGPIPADGAIHEDTWVSLSWTAGGYAVSHDVYIGENFDDVNNGAESTFQGNQSEAFIVVGFPGYPYPDGLVPGTTYYWRIDEVNEADPNSPWKGDIWSFSIPPKTAYDPTPADGDGIAETTVTLTWTAGFGAKLHTIYFGDDYDTVANATVGVPAGETSHNPGPLEAEKVYYWRVDEFDGIGTYKGEVWTFTTPGAVGNPQPANGATDVAMAAVLNWTAADNAASHEVYLGLDKNAVRSADTASPEYQGPKALGAENYDPGLLEPGTTYYWRVDEVYTGNTVKGPVWTFTVGNYLLVDDFERYTDDDVAGEAIWQTWIDGFGVADNGAQVGYLVPPYCEQTIVHGGLQSMPLMFVNEAGVTHSEATKTLTTPRDWTAAGVGELSLWIRGDSANAADPLYVSIANSAGSPVVVAHEDPATATIRSWTQWRIPLQAFADQGINLTNVDKIAIGLGSKGGAAAGGTGTVYVDDIRLYRP